MSTPTPFFHRHHFVSPAAFLLMPAPTRISFAETLKINFFLFTPISSTLSYPFPPLLLSSLSISLISLSPPPTLILLFFFLFFFLNPSDYNKRHNSEAGPKFFLLFWRQALMKSLLLCSFPSRYYFWDFIVVLMMILIQDAFTTTGQCRFQHFLPISTKPREVFLLLPDSQQWKKKQTKKNFSQPPW